MAQKVAFVTGGMGGIGTAICQRLHEEATRSSPAAARAATTPSGSASRRQQGYTFHASVGNVADCDRPSRPSRKVKAEDGPVDVLVNNAGITRDACSRR